MLETFRADRVDQRPGQSEQVFTLGNVLHDDLVCHVSDRAGASIGLIAAVHVPIEENALPGNEHVIEHNDSVHLLKS